MKCLKCAIILNFIVGYTVMNVLYVCAVDSISCDEARWGARLIKGSPLSFGFNIFNCGFRRIYFFYIFGIYSNRSLPLN